MSTTKRKLFLANIVFLIACLPCALAPIITLSTPVTENILVKQVKIGCYIAAIYHVLLFINCLITIIMYKEIKYYTLLKILNYISYPIQLACFITLKQYYSFMVVTLVMTFINTYLLKRIIKEDKFLKEEDPYSEFYIHRKPKKIEITDDTQKK